MKFYYFFVLFYLSIDKKFLISGNNQKITFETIFNNYFVNGIYEPKDLSIRFMDDTKYLPLLDIYYYDKYFNETINNKSFLYKDCLNNSFSIKQMNKLIKQLIPYETSFKWDMESSFLLNMVEYIKNNIPCTYNYFKNIGSLIILNNITDKSNKFFSSKERSKVVVNKDILFKNFDRKKHVSKKLGKSVAFIERLENSRKLIKKVDKMDKIVFKTIEQGNINRTVYDLLVLSNNLFHYSSLYGLFSVDKDFNLTIIKDLFIKNIDNELDLSLESYNIIARNIMLYLYSTDAFLYMDSKTISDILYGYNTNYYIDNGLSYMHYYYNIMPNKNISNVPIKYGFKYKIVGNKMCDNRNISTSEDFYEASLFSKTVNCKFAINSKDEVNKIVNLITSDIKNKMIFSNFFISKLDLLDEMVNQDYNNYNYIFQLVLSTFSSRYFDIISYENNKDNILFYNLIERFHRLIRNDKSEKSEYVNFFTTFNMIGTISQNSDFVNLQPHTTINDALLYVFLTQFTPSMTNVQIENYGYSKKSEKYKTSLKFIDMLKSISKLIPKLNLENRENFFLNKTTTFLKSYYVFCSNLLSRGNVPKIFKDPIKMSVLDIHLKAKKFKKITINSTYLSTPTIIDTTYVSYGDLLLSTDLRNRFNIREFETSQFMFGYDDDKFNEIRKNYYFSYNYNFINEFL